MPVNFLVNADSFRWIVPTENRSNCIDDLTIALALIFNNGQRLWGHPDAHDLNLSWGNFHEVIVYNQDLASIRASIPWIRHDHIKTLLRMWSSKCTPEQSRTLVELNSEFVGELNGLFGCQTNPITPGLVFDIVSWNEHKVTYFLANQIAINWQEHFCLPNKGYSNLHLASLKTNLNEALCCAPLKIESEAKEYVFETLRHMAAGGNKEALAREIGREIARRNFYLEETVLSTHEQQLRNSLRTIFSSIKHGRKIYLSIDFEKPAFEICDEQGHHLGEYSFNGLKLSDLDATGGHDILSLRN
jgi:hypothetical protein